MHLLRLGAVVLVFTALCGGAAPPVAAAPASEEESREGSDLQRLWVDSVGRGGRNGITLEVRCDGVVAADQEVAFECEISAEAEMGSASLVLEISDSFGKVLERGQIDLRVDKGTGLCRFDWSPVGLPDGAYSARFECLRRDGLVVGWEELALVKLSESNVLGTFQRAVEAVESVKVHVDRLGEGVPKSPYLRMRLALADDFIHQVDAGNDDWRRVHRIASYALATAESVRFHMALNALPPELGDSVPEPDLATLAIEKGALYAGGRPVFLAGIRGRGLSADDIARVGRYGLNLAVMEETPPQDPPSEETVRSRLRTVFQSARRNNVSVTYLFSTREHETDGGHGIRPGRTGYREPLEIWRYVRPRLSSILSHLAGQEMLNSVSLAYEPSFQFEGEDVRADFISHVESVYLDRHSLNRAWRSRFRGFDEVDLWPDYERWSYQYDWQIHHRSLGTRYLSEVAKFVREIDPRIKIQVTLGGDVFEPGESRKGVDHEYLATLFPFSGTSGSGSLGDPVYAMAYPGESALFVLRRSLRPDNPVFHLEGAMAGRGGEPLGDVFGFVHSLVWEAGIEGVNAFAMPGWDAGDGASQSYLTRPEALEALATACLDLNRLGGIVTAFQRDRARVAILWSDSAKIYDDGRPHLASALRAYEGVSFTGRKVRFISEKQCARGELADIEALILPDTPALSDAAFDAVQEFATQGGTIIRSAKPIPYDAWGHSRKDVLALAKDTLLVRGRDASTEYMHAMDAALSMGMIAKVPRAINAFGYPLEGVKTRYVEVGGESYLYVINLRKEPVFCHFYGAFTGGRDLIHGVDVEFPTEIESLYPLLVRLDAPPTALEALDAGAEEEGYDSAEIPTVKVGPVDARPSGS